MTTKTTFSTNLDPAPGPVQSVPQQPLPPVYISIRELSRERDRFNISPEFQRKEAWSITMAQAFIDTILMGDPIPPMECYEEFDQITGLKTYVFNDGHQRITTILNFVDGVFRTWTPAEKRNAEPGSEPPVEPRKFVSGLSLLAYNHLMDYHIQLNRIRKRSEEQIRTRFLRIQNHVPLSAAEKLNAYKSRANQTARIIEQHPFWRNFYAGKTHRDQRFQTSLQLLAIELAGDVCDVHSVVALQKLASGQLDHLVGDGVVEKVSDKLNMVESLYHGVTFSERGACIAMYQSILLLEQAGYTFQAMDKGKLTHWMQELMVASGRTGWSGYGRPLLKLITKNGQRVFWDKYRSPLLNLFGLSATP